MARYRQDPRWITAKFDSKCSKCESAVKRGTQAFYYPLTRTVYCHDCGSIANAEFQAMAFDEDTFNS